MSGCWSGRTDIRTNSTRVSADAVRRVLHDPPYWLSGSYLAAYQDGRLSVEVLAYAVTAALSYSPYDPATVGEVTSILEGMGYGDEVAAVLV